MKLITKILLPIITICMFATTIDCNAQTSNAKRTNHWYFGANAGIDFSSPVSPTPISNSSMNNSFEGTATISDTNGNLLLYTDGITVWNASHSVIQNGTDLFGHPSSSQAALFIPLPENNSIYYLFTCDKGPYSSNPGNPDSSITRGIHYSIIDVNKDSIISKNIPLLDKTTEKLTAVTHCNNEDIWIVGHQFGNNHFYSWLITPNGIEDTVISMIGSVHDSSLADYSIGYMKGSPDGKKLAVAVSETDTVELFDFNSLTGEITNPLTITSVKSPYGLSFSPDNTKLYVSSNFETNFGLTILNEVVQFDLLTGNGNADSITNSKITLIKDDDIFSAEYYFGSLQLAADGKIYVARVGANFVDIIHEPNIKGIACNYEEEGFTLSPGSSCQYGLPNFYEGFFRDSSTTALKYTGICIGDTTYFTDISGGNISSRSWNFGDPASHEEDTSTKINPIHYYNEPGTYLVTLIIETNCGLIDTLIQAITIREGQGDAGPDQVIFKGTATLLGATGGETYNWMPSDSVSDSTIFNPSIQPGNTMWFYVDIVDSLGCTNTDSVLIEVLTNPVIKAPTAFTPNNDGINDLYKIIHFGISDINHYTIFNRWGEAVFSSNNISDQWDGTYKSEKQENGSYLLSISAVGIDNSTLNLNQSILLLE